MTEEQKRLWDVRLGIAAPIITVVGLLLAVWQFSRAEENKTRLELRLIAENQRAEFARQAHLDRAKAYQAVADIAGRIVATDKKDQAQKTLTNSFVAAYWGSMVMVEDRPVELAMIGFHDDLHAYWQGQRSIEDLKKRAKALVTAMRYSVTAASR